MSKIRVARNRSRAAAFRIARVTARYNNLELTGGWVPVSEAPRGPAAVTPAIADGRN